MRSQRDEPRFGDDLRGAINAASLLTAAFARWFNLWARVPGTMGDRALGTPFCIGMVLMFIWPIFWQHDPNSGAMVLLMAGTLSMAAVHVAARNRKVAPCHSRYTGRSWLHRYGERRAKFHLEPALLMLLGAVACLGSGALGSWMVISGIASSLEFSLDEQALLDRKRRMRDAELEARYYASERWDDE